MTPSVAETEALQEALAAEHAAVYGYGIVGARLRGSGRTDAAYTAYLEHLAGRERLEAVLLDRGITPVASEPAYRLPFPVTNAAAAVRLAVTIEQRVAATYADLVADSAGQVRRLGAAALQEAAVRAASWRGTGVAFPGLAERA